MRIRETQRTARRTQHHCSAQHETFRNGHLHALRSETCTYNDIELFAAQFFDHLLSICNFVLSVRVERDKIVRTVLGTCVLDTGLQRCPLPEVHGMANKMCPCAHSHRC